MKGNRPDPFEEEVEVDRGAEFYRRYLSGDMSGLNDLVELYGNHLMMFIHGYVRNLTVAEDLMEDVFVELLMNNNPYRGNSQFRTWLFQIGKNKALNYLKRENRYQMVVPEDVEYALAEESQVVEYLFQDQRQQLMHKALKAIKQEYAEALFLVFFENMTYQQAAEVLGKNTKQIDNLIARGKKQLRKEIERLEEEVKL